MSKNSTYFFIGKLEPFEECKDFNPGELSLGDGWTLDINLDLICIWKSGVVDPFDKINPFIKELFSLIIALFIFRSKILLKFRLTNWIEAKEIESVKNLIGVYVSRYSQPRRNARINVTWKKCAHIFSKFQHHQLFRLALKDCVTSLQEEGDDSFFYAYRALENTCRAITGAKTDITKQHWEQMHKKVGTCKTLIDPLTAAALDIRHGNISGTGLENARKNRKQVLGISRNVLATAFKKYFRGYL